MTATVPATPEAFRPPGYERIDVTLRFVDGAFAVPTTNWP